MKPLTVQRPGTHYLPDNLKDVFVTYFTLRPSSLPTSTLNAFEVLPENAPSLYKFTVVIPRYYVHTTTHGYARIRT